MWSLLIDIYYYEKNYATKQSNQSQIHTQSWKIAQKVSKNAILKNIAKMAKNKRRILQKQSAAFWRKKKLNEEKNKQNINYSSESSTLHFFWLWLWTFSYLFYLLLDVIYCNFLAQKAANKPHRTSIPKCTDYGHMMTKPLILCSHKSNPNPKKIFGIWVFLEKGLTVPKWMLINWPKISQCPKIYLPKPKVWDFNEKRLHWASVFRALNTYGINIIDLV